MISELTEACMEFAAKLPPLIPCLALLALPEPAQFHVMHVHVTVQMLKSFL